MNTKERRRLAVLGQVEAGHLSVAEAGHLLDLSERQVRRVWKRYQADGDAGLVHRLRGGPGNRRTDLAVRERALALYGEHYSDFGCTLASEMLLEHHGLVVDDQTLRRWLTSAGLWHRRRKSPTKRRRRERRACLGQLVQMDGSHHDWFEGRRGPCVLMVMIDDATSLTMAWFVEGETTLAAMTIFEQWSRSHGLPTELYPDRHSIYRVNTKSADEQEIRTGQRPMTQFGRAMSQLGVKLTCAKSPQAKGRVERMNGTLQDRLVKALRLAGINTIDAANTYLEQKFLTQLNQRFMVAPASAADAHLAVSEAVLHASLCVQQQRTVGRDHCVSWQGRVLQLKAPKALASLAGKCVTVQQALDATVSVHWREQTVAWQAVDQRPHAVQSAPSLAQRVAEHQPPGKPSANHPWRRGPATRRPLAGAGSSRHGGLRPRTSHRTGLVGHTSGSSSWRLMLRTTPVARPRPARVGAGGATSDTASQRARGTKRCRGRGAFRKWHSCTRRLDRCTPSCAPIPWERRVTAGGATGIGGVCPFDARGSPAVACECGHRTVQNGSLLLRCKSGNGRTSRVDIGSPVLGTTWATRPTTGG